MAEQDDPYADHWMIQIQEKLESSKSELEVIKTRLDQSMSALPVALHVGENVNVHPVTLNRPGFSRHLASSLRNAFQTLPVTAAC
nr:AcaB family transcriptional regulator [Pseudomonas lurida]